jgi:hypothetical protein
MKTEVIVMLFATCMAKVNGRPVAPPVALENLQAAWHYVTIQKRLYPEVRITAPDRSVIIQAVDEEVIHPAYRRQHWQFSKL